MSGCLDSSSHQAPRMSLALFLYIPKGSNVVPFWVCYGFGVRDYNILPEKELHRRVWVEPRCLCARVCFFSTSGPQKPKR